MTCRQTTRSMTELRALASELDEDWLVGRMYLDMKALREATKLRLALAA